MRKAFTTTELLIVLLTLGFLTIVAIYHMAPSKTFNAKRIKAMSENFYSISEGIFQQILFKHATEDITKIEDTNGDKKITSVDLKNLFSKYTVANDIDCSQIKITSTQLSGYLTDASCVEIEPNTKAGFYLDTTCTKSLVANEYYNPDDDITRNVTNSCGYIIYAFTGSVGVLGEDIFVIPFEKRNYM